MSTFTNRYAEQIFGILSPLVGSVMAKTIIQLQCSKMGINEEQLTKEYMHLISDNIRKGLVTFLGSESATVVANKIANIS